jgi:hypothetical protein
MKRGVGRPRDFVKAPQRVETGGDRKSGRLSPACFHDGVIDWEDLNSDHPRRRHSRRPVKLLARLWMGGREVVATCENISPGGAYLRVQLPETTKDVVASIGLPHGRGLHVRARVRWRDRAGVGVEFAAFLESTREALSESA